MFTRRKLEPEPTLQEVLQSLAGTNTYGKKTVAIRTRLHRAIKSELQMKLDVKEFSLNDLSASIASIKDSVHKFIQGEINHILDRVNEGYLGIDSLGGYLNHVRSCDERAQMLAKTMAGLVDDRKVDMILKKFETGVSERTRSRVIGELDKYDNVEDRIQILNDLKTMRMFDGTKMFSLRDITTFTNYIEGDDFQRAVIKNLRSE